MLRKRHTLSLSIAFACFFVVATTAQRPDFSGAWKLDPNANQVPPGTPEDLTIKQTATEMVVDFHIEGAVVTYNLDGSETTGKTFKGGTLKFRPKWDGGKLVVTVQEPALSDGRIPETVQVYELNGDRLIFETTRLGKTFRQIYTK